jgi:SAM-dependent methyltransferase
MATVIAFETLPLWRGVSSIPGPPESLPFQLVTNSLGFFTQDQPPDIRKSIAEAYGRPDYRFITPPPGLSDWATALGSAKIDALVAACGPLDGSVLEIGAGNLTIANEIVRRFKVVRYVAVDPAISDGQHDAILSIRGFFPTTRIVGQKFDLIVAFSCLEHVENPLDFLKVTLEHLSPTGRVFLTFPDVGEMLCDGDLNALVHEHMSYFDEAGFRKLAKVAGLDVVNLKSKNGLFSVLLHRSERDVFLSTDNPGNAAGIRKAYQCVTNELGALIQHRIARGDTIGFHGACPGLNNFLWLTKMGTSPKIIVADGDRSKWGSFLPASQSSIRPPSDGGYLASDYIFVAATNFIDAIKRDLMASGVNPGRIAPLTMSGVALSVR